MDSLNKKSLINAMYMIFEMRWESMSKKNQRNFYKAEIIA